MAEGPEEESAAVDCTPPQPAKGWQLPQRALLYHTGNAQKKAVKKRCFVRGMPCVLYKLRRVGALVDIDLAVRAARHLMRHDCLQAVGTFCPRQARKKEDTFCRKDAAYTNS